MINLLPPEVKEQKRYSQYNRLLSFAIIGIVVLGLITAAAFYASWLILSKEEARLTTDITEESQKTQAYGQIENQAKVLADRLATIEKIQTNRTRYPALLQALAEATPPDAYVASFAVDTAGKTMTLTTYAASDQAAASFKNALEASDRFSSAAIQVLEPATDPYTDKPTNRVTFVVGLEAGALK